jgi:hypothetical protein
MKDTFEHADEFVSEIIKNRPIRASTRDSTPLWLYLQDNNLMPFEERTMAAFLEEQGKTIDDITVSGIGLYVCPCCPTGVKIEYLDKIDNENYQARFSYHNADMPETIVGSDPCCSYEFLETFEGVGLVWGFKKLSEAEKRWTLEEMF